MVKSNNKDLNPEMEFNLLKSLENPYLLRHTGNDFYFDEFYCFLTEFCAVIYFYLYMRL